LDTFGRKPILSAAKDLLFHSVDLHQVRCAYVYVMSNRNHRIYVGSTTNLSARVAQHKRKFHPGAFTSRYNFYRLVWFEAAVDREAAERREAEIKGWTRAKKVALIQGTNPNWRDLSAT
jgi:putative endonuclease